MSTLDTIPVRPDEGFDERHLAAYLQDKLPGADGLLTVRQFGGGAANLTYLLDYSSHQYVLRRPPLGPVAKSAHDMGREYYVLSHLAPVYPPAPDACVFCDDPSIIGAKFFVMQRKEGIVVRKHLPSPFDTPLAPRQMAEALVDTLADLHAVDYEAIGLADLGEPVGFIQRQIAGWWRRWQAAKTCDLSEMDAVYQWLQTHTPPSSSASLVHNDFKLDNVMLAEEDPGQIVAVLDWDMCTLGEPLSDLGTLLTYWTEPGDLPAFQQMAMMPVDPRFPSRRDLVERYAARSGRDVSTIQFYHALGLYRLAVILAQIYIRFVRGQTQDRRFASMDNLIPLTAQAALLVAEGYR